jgi:phage FluMu gp28-like protein
MKSAISMSLLPYQSAFAANKSRFKIGLWARQTGKDFTCAAEAVFDCIRNPKTNWLIVAAGERQAIESLEKAKEWAEHLKFDIENYSVSSGTSLHRNASAEIKFYNGSRIIALPAKLETIRGYSANVILTEFAFHENPDAIWRAIYPSISNPLRGGPKKLRIISTPNGLSNKFADLWFNTQTFSESSSQTLSNGSVDPAPDLRSSRREEALNNSAIRIPHSAMYFKSRLTIHDAIARGLPLDPAELRAGLNDEDAWSQEYLCEFTDNSKILLPYDLIESCESSLATEQCSPQSLSASILPANNNRAPELFAGLDFARKNHLTVCWLFERVPNPNRNLNPNLSSLSPPRPPRGEGQGEGCSSYPQSAFSNPQSIFITREVLCLRDLPTPDQLEILLPRLRRCRSISVDYTGPGIGLGDYLQKELAKGGARPPGAPGPRFTHNARPRINLELCQFTTAFKSELFPRLRAAFENRELQIPPSRDIREDLHSLYSTVTNSGQVIYRAPCTPGGHADRATALALALRAAQSIPASVSSSTVRPYNINSVPQDPRYLPPPRLLAVIY